MGTPRPTPSHRRPSSVRTGVGSHSSTLSFQAGRRTSSAVPSSGTMVYVCSTPGPAENPLLLALIASVSKVTGFSRETPRTDDSSSAHMRTPISGFGCSMMVTKAPTGLSWISICCPENVNSPSMPLYSSRPGSWPGLSGPGVKFGKYVMRVSSPENVNLFAPKSGAGMISNSFDCVTDDVQAVFTLKNFLQRGAAT